MLPLLKHISFGVCDFTTYMVIWSQKGSLLSLFSFLQRSLLKPLCVSAYEREGGFFFQFLFFYVFYLFYSFSLFLFGFSFSNLERPSDWSLRSWDIENPTGDVDVEGPIGDADVEKPIEDVLEMVRALICFSSWGKLDTSIPSASDPQLWGSQAEGVQIGCSVLR